MSNGFTREVSFLLLSSSLWLKKPQYWIRNSRIRGGVEMKVRVRILGVFFAILFLAGVVTGQAGELRRQPYSQTPTWTYTDNSGNSTTIRERPYSMTPTFDFNDNRGNFGTIQKRPYTLMPTWDVNK